MKNQMLNLIKVTALAAILAAGVSAVSAFQAPASGPGLTPVPDNVSGDAQKKVGGFISELFLKSGNANPFALSGAAAAGWIIAEDKIVSPWSFSIKTFLPGNTSQMKIGSADETLDGFTDATFPLTIDLSGRGVAPAPSGRNAIDFMADTNFCNTKTTIRTNTPGVQFWSTKNGDNADLIARQVQLNGSNPGKDKVLISTDTDGNATWATVSVVNGAITYTNYETIPVVENCGTPPPPNPIPGCMNPAAPEYNSNATVDDGSCTLPAVDLCINIAGNQLTVPTGMVKDTAGNTPGNCALPVDMCPNIIGTQETIPSGYIINFQGFCVLEDQIPGPNGGGGGGPGNNDNGDGLDCDVGLDGTTDCI